MLIFANDACFGAPAASGGTDVRFTCRQDGSLSALDVNGRHFEIAPDERQGASLNEALRGIKGPVRLIAGEDTPYRCIGGAIFTMQVSGVNRVDFMPEPHAPETH